MHPCVRRYGGYKGILTLIDAELATTPNVYAAHVMLRNSYVRHSAERGIGGEE